MKYLKSVFTKVQNRFLIAAAVCALVGLIISSICNGVVNNQKYQNLAKRWSKENDFAQVSCFFSELSGFDEKSLDKVFFGVESRLNEDTITADNENARRWIYSYCANGNLSVSSKKASADVKAIGVGGDFFLFHPLTLISGAFFDEEDKERNPVVIDEDVAWTLFGSNDVVGQIVEIGGEQHFVSAVIKRDTGRVNDLSDNNVPTIYVSYKTLSVHGSVEYINTYEALIPNPITGYAIKTLKEAISTDEKRCEYVENTGRYSWLNLIKSVKNFGIRGMNKKAIVYPYWENVARAVEEYLTPVTLLYTLLYFFSGFVILVLLIRMWFKRTVHINDIVVFIENCIDRYRVKKRMKRRTNEQV